MFRSSRSGVQRRLQRTFEYLPEWAQGQKGQKTPSRVLARNQFKGITRCPMMGSGKLSDSCAEEGPERKKSQRSELYYCAFVTHEKLVFHG